VVCCKESYLSLKLQILYLDNEIISRAVQIPLYRKAVDKKMVGNRWDILVRKLVYFQKTKISIARSIE
jgi:hypothetical protein